MSSTLRFTGWLDLYSVSVVVPRNGFSGFRTVSALATMSCALSAWAALCAHTRASATTAPTHKSPNPRRARSTLNMPERVHDLEPGGPVGRKKGGKRRHDDQDQPDRRDEGRRT